MLRENKYIGTASGQDAKPPKAKAAGKSALRRADAAGDVD